MTISALWPAWSTTDGILTTVDWASAMTISAPWPASFDA
jgi:hypothetical protein